MSLVILLGTNVTPLYLKHILISVLPPVFVHTLLKLTPHKISLYPFHIPLSIYNSLLYSLMQRFRRYSLSQDFIKCKPWNLAAD
jgi:hypothetical protein